MPPLGPEVLVLALLWFLYGERSTNRGQLQSGCKHHCQRQRPEARRAVHFQVTVVAHPEHLPARFISLISVGICLTGGLWLHLSYSECSSGKSPSGVRDAIKQQHPCHQYSRSIIPVIRILAKMGHVLTAMPYSFILWVGGKYFLI